MFEVTRLEQLDPQKPTLFEVGGRSLVLIRWGDEVYALRNLCPHQSHSFVDGIVHERVLGTEQPGEIRLSEGAPVLACPMHSWEYELKTGMCPIDARLRVKTYRVAIENGAVLVDVGRDAKLDDE